MHKILTDINIQILENNAVILNDVRVGLVNPSSIWMKTNDKVIVNGSSGLKIIDCSSGFSAVRDMVSVGAVLLGTSLEISEAIEVLQEPTINRTAVYLCSCSTDLKFFCEAIRNTLKSHVAIVGCGGIGSSVAYLLAGAGVSKLSIFDSDIIERSNFNRQSFWSMKTIGKQKICVLKDELLARFPGLIVDCYNCDIRDLLIDNSPLTESNFAVVTVDTPFHVNLRVCEFLQKNMIPFVGGGYNHASMIIYDDASLLPQASSNSSWKSLSNRFISSSFGPSNFEIAGLVANRVLQCIWNVEHRGHLGVRQTADSRVFPRRFEIEK